MQVRVRSKTKKLAGSHKAKSGSRKDTRTRIIERSIVLFNRHGLQKVAIEQIAADLKISPGNLTYHFGRKRSLISATLEVLQEHLRVGLALPTVKTTRDSAEYIVRTFRTFWEVRFFFNSLTFLLSSDRELRRQFNELHSWVLDLVVNGMQQLQSVGLLREPDPPNSYRLLAEGLWGVWLHWLRMTQIECPRAIIPPNKIMAGGVLQMWCICEPWTPTEFARELLEILEELLSTPMPDTAKTPPGKPAAPQSALSSFSRQVRSVSGATKPHRARMSEPA